MNQTLRLAAKAKTAASTGRARPLDRWARNGVALPQYHTRLKPCFYSNNSSRSLLCIQSRYQCRISAFAYAAKRPVAPLVSTRSRDKNPKQTGDWNCSLVQGRAASTIFVGLNDPVRVRSWSCSSSILLKFEFSSHSEPLRASAHQL